MAKTIDTYAEAVASWLKNPGLMGLAILFALVQLYVLGILPSIKNTYTVNITTRNNAILAAEAKYADLRQQAEAQLQTEEATINAEKAKNADRRTAALARKSSADAKTKISEAFNSPELQTALKDIDQQESIINSEKAKQEDRKAKALADKSHYESIINEANGRVAQAVALNRTIKTNAEAISACVNSYILSLPPEQAYDKSLELGNTAAGDDQGVYPEFRRACVKPPKPNAPSTQTAQAPTPPQGGCAKNFAEWKQKAAAFAAFASGAAKCGWSYDRKTAADAEKMALYQCEDSDCQIYAAKPDDAATTVSTTVAASATPGSVREIVVAQELNVHIGANKDTRTCGKLAQNQPVDVLKTYENGWVRIHGNCEGGAEGNGYVNGASAYLKPAN